MNKQWSKEETAYLIKYAITLTVAQLATGLDGRTVGGVRYKLRQMGLSAKVNVVRRRGIKLRIKESSPLWREG